MRYTNDLTDTEWQLIHYCFPKAGKTGQWASAVAELESGGISNATALFANITINFPSMPTLPHRGYDIYKNIDWKLFDKLVGTNAPP